MIDLPVVEPTTMEMVPVTHECVMEAAKRFDLPARAIYAILSVEGGTVGKVSKNSNGSYDIGPMQINSLWLETFKDHVTKEQLLNDGCVNVQVGSWILKANINQAGGDFWKGIGNYHSRTPEHHKRYKLKVYSAANP